MTREWFTDEDIEQGRQERQTRTLLPDEFWDASPVLGHVRAAAFSRLRSPDAVLAVLMTRYAALVPPSIVLPPIAGGIGSLNMIVGIVSRSGGRKSSTVAVARDLLEIPEKRAISDQPLGSGEGIAEAYFTWEKDEDSKGNAKKIKVRTIDSVHLYVDEGATIVSLGQRNGSTTSSTLRTAWSGGTLGQLNSSQDSKRVVTEHTYRLGLVAAFQFSNAANILAEAEVGTPQRFLWAITEHPDIGRDTPPAWPGSLEIPHLFTVAGKHRQVIFSDAITDEIRQAETLEASGRLIVDALDTHRRMMKMKVASMLSLMISDPNELIVSDLHWRLAETWVTVSDNIRQLIADEHQRTQADLALQKINAKVRESVAVRQAAIEVDRTEERNRVTVCAIKLAHGVAAGRYTTRKEALHAMRRYRAEFEEAYDQALAEGWIVEYQGAGQGVPTKLVRKGPATPPEGAS